jgi:hypothetical protein
MTAKPQTLKVTLTEKQHQHLCCALDTEIKRIRRERKRREKSNPDFKSLIGLLSAQEQEATALLEYLQEAGLKVISWGSWSATCSCYGGFDCPECNPERYEEQRKTVN